MNTYFSIFRMRLITGMQYRAAAWAGVATQFFWGFMYIMIYQAFYRSSAAEPPMPWEQLISYMWLQQSFLMLIMIWFQDGELLSGITSGHVAYELCRPYDIYAFWYIRLLAMRVSGVLLRCLPILLIAFWLPSAYRMMMPFSIGAFALFILSLILALFLVVAVSMFIYVLTFITLSPLGARLLVGVASEFLMGTIIPIPLMPDFLQKILNWLPFRYIGDLPFRVYSGNISGTDALWQIGIQMVWIIILIMLSKSAFRHILRHVVVQGG